MTHQEVITNSDEVKPLPGRPQGFEGIFTSFDFPDDIDCPQRLTQTSKYIAAVEWSWSPYHSRMDSYYLTTNQKRSHWILWHGFLDENEYPERWVYRPYAYGPRTGVTPQAAAYFLLLDAWRGEGETHEMGRFHAITSTGMLSADELRQIASQVWGE